MQKIIHHLKNLREQPEHVRRHVLHVTTMVFGVVLVLLWIYSLGTNLANPKTQAKIGDDLKPLSALKANILGGYNSMTDGQ
jgi:hypothetical protein